MGYHAAPRLHGFDYVGLHRYSITCCTFKRRPWFSEESVVEPVRAQLLAIMSDHTFGIIAYCFMPDHVHALLDAKAERCARKPAMQRWKQACGYAHKRGHGVPLWQTGYYDRIIREDADVLAAAAYIVANPLRAGLVTSVLDYPYSGSDRFGMQELAEAIQVGRCRRDG
jgi:REP element-mobilizing transposase RayT